MRGSASSTLPKTMLESRMKWNSSHVKMTMLRGLVILRFRVGSRGEPGKELQVLQLLRQIGDVLHQSCHARLMHKYTAIDFDSPDKGNGAGALGDPLAAGPDGSSQAKSRQPCLSLLPAHVPPWQKLLRKAHPRQTCTWYNANNRSQQPIAILSIFLRV